jgi:hypothetical protein
MGQYVVGVRPVMLRNVAQRLHRVRQVRVDSWNALFESRTSLIFQLRISKSRLAGLSERWRGHRKSIDVMTKGVYYSLQRSRRFVRKEVLNVRSRLIRQHLLRGLTLRLLMDVGRRVRVWKRLVPSIYNPQNRRWPLR